jgi:hypothetical protein
MTNGKWISSTAGLAATLVLAVLPSVWAQQATGKAEAPAMSPMVQPGPEHAVLQHDEGTWDATVEMATGPGAPPAVSKGVETVTMAGGLFQVTDFQSEMMGQPFRGHGVTIWDTAKKQYVSTWIDNMSSGFTHGEATYDAAAKKMSGTMEGPDATGKIMNIRVVTSWPDRDTRVFMMYMKSPDGKEAPGMTITYKRRK